MLTERQIELLQAIINDYITTAEPVGSVEIVRNHNLRCSAATIRNEMAKLIDLGFLEMLHTSSGRVPTKMAYKLYIEQMMEEQELPVLQEVALKQRLWSNRFELEKLLRETTLALAEATDCLAIAVTDDGYVTYAGAVKVLEHKEYWDIDIAKATLKILDDYETLNRIFQSVMPGQETYTLIGDEIPVENLDKSTIIFTPFRIGEKTGNIAILGPSRLNYSKTIPVVKYTKKLLEELGGSW
jgi:transcriptional regulator of heat shock response